MAPTSVPPATTSSATTTSRRPTSSLRPRKAAAKTTVQSTPVPTIGATTFDTLLHAAHFTAVPRHAYRPRRPLADPHTSGSIPFYETYPGPYVPTPLSITLESSGGGRRHGLELLALTKLNWNHSRLDGHDPITTHAARKIGSILRHIEPDGPIGNRYAFYT